MPVDQKERFHEAIDTLYEKNHHLAGQVSRLGYPKMVGGYPPTAGVLWNKERKKIEFLFNKRFAEKITEEEYLFAVAHESSHVFHGHVFMLKTEVDRLRAMGRSKKEINAWVRKFNKAADCVINDSLVNLYGLPRCEFPDEAGNCSILYGKNVVGCDCHELSVLDVMALMPEDPEGDDVDDNGQLGGGGGHGGWDSFFDSDGSIDRSFADAMQDFIEENLDNAGLSDQDAEDLEKLQESMQNCSDPHVRQAGRSTSSSMRRGNASRASLRWEQILFRKVERNKFEDKWNRRSRKLQGFPPDLLLPVSKAKETEDIFIAIDVSGSIDWAALELFVSVVKNIPKHFKINAITFNTVCRPFDIRSDQVRAGGGTAFQPIEDYIQDNFKRYPKAVFVLTDGGGTPVRPQYPGRWTWMLYGSATTAYCSDMSHYKMESLLK
jgi:hypothetical protein